MKGPTNCGQLLHCTIHSFGTNTQVSVSLKLIETSGKPRLHRWPWWLTGPLSLSTMQVAQSPAVCCIHGRLNVLQLWEKSPNWSQGGSSPKCCVLLEGFPILIHAHLAAAIRHGPVTPSSISFPSEKTLCMARQLPIQTRWNQRNRRLPRQSPAGLVKRVVPFKSAGPANVQANSSWRKIARMAWCGRWNSQRIRRDFCASGSAEKAHEQQRDPCSRTEQQSSKCAKKYMYDRNIQRRLKKV